jgi:hypothetical protein
MSARVRLSNSNEIVPLHQKNGYYYAWLSTPNYPGDFKTPFVKNYIIDASGLSGLNSTRINVYMTELLVSGEYIKIADANMTGAKRPNKTVGWHLGTTHATTTSNYMEIQVNIDDPHSHHLRMKDFLNNYGFNISIEVVESELNVSQSMCTLQKCSFAGTCRTFLGDHRL